MREQLAGDEIDPADPEMLVATGFLRMGPRELTGMEVAKVARQRFLDDVTHNVGETFLAHSLQCARCPDHKFDPIPTRDDYSLEAVFATTQLAERPTAVLSAENASGFEEKKYLELRRAEYLATPSRPPVSFTSSRSTHQTAQSLGDFIATKNAGGDVKREGLPIVHRQVFASKESVFTEKDKARREGHSFVPIDEGVIAAQIEQVSRSDLNRFGNHRLPHHRRLGSGHRRLQQLSRSQARTPPMRRQNFRVYRQDRFNRWMSQFHGQDSRLKSSALFRIKRFAVSAAVSADISGGSIGLIVIVPP